MDKVCTKCNETKDLSLFEKKKTGKWGRGSWCKKCKSLDRSNYSRSKNYRKSNLKYYYSHKSARRAIKARRRAALLKATVAGYEAELKLIYVNCSEGMEVDHIVPLQGKIVCGLHVPWNLQYLSPEENRKKSNVFK